MQLPSFTWLQYEQIFTSYTMISSGIPRNIPHFSLYKMYTAPQTGAIFVCTADLVC